ncbi:MAG TPA: DinB family protein [Candidatus Krumholzibacteria bacterium]|nr:DinB family protein [Candidatus Krumholzibacteria bacterium]
MINEIRIIMARDLRAFAREIELFPDDELVWKTPTGISNSAGNLALHACGNLQHFIGHELGGTDYIRDREHEFGARAGARADLVREIQTTCDVVELTLNDFPASSLDLPFPQPVLGVTLPTRTFLLHLTAHLAFHLGQAGYLRRVLTGDATTAGSMSPRELGA